MNMLEKYLKEHDKRQQAARRFQEKYFPEPLSDDAKLIREAIRAAAEAGGELEVHIDYR